MLALAPLLLALPLPLAQDRLERTDGRAVTAHLVRAGLSEVVTAGADGKETKIPAADLMDVVPAPATELMRRGEEAARQRDWSAAANAFSAAAAETGGAEWAPAWAGLRHGEALLAWSSTDPARAAEAASALRKWSDANPESFWFPRSRLAQARALVLAGDTDGAASLLQGLSDVAFQKGLPKHLEVEINLERCRAFLAGRQAEVAEARLRDLATKDPPADAPRAVRSRMLKLRGDAQVLLGDAITAKSGPRAAMAYWEGLARDPASPPDVRAAALIGLAATARADGRLREAQLQLAEVVAVLGAGQEIRGRALYELAEVTAQLGDHPTPAKSYYERLLRECPDSSYAALAKAKLGG